METHGYSYEDDISDEQNLTSKAFKQTLEDNGLNLTPRLMNTLGLKFKSKYTNLAYLLSDQSEIVVKVAEYDSQMNFKIKKSFKGSLVNILKNVEEQVERLNDLKVVIDGSSFKRTETKSYPGASIGEMIFNAICHANYFIHSNIKVEFFPDKVKITSPGGIFNASMDDIMNGVQTYRNPRLVHVLDKLGLIENFGTGIPRTIEAYDSYKIKLEFKATENFFFVTFPNVNCQQNESINDIGLEILKIVKKYPGINIPKITIELQIADSSITKFKVRNEIQRNLSKYIEHKGSNKDGGYYLKE